MIGKLLSWADGASDYIGDFITKIALFVTAATFGGFFLTSSSESRISIVAFFFGMAFSLAMATMGIWLQNYHRNKFGGKEK